MVSPLYHYINPFLMLKLKDILARFSPDIIHVHNINLQTFSLCALLFSRKYPMIWTLHDVWPLCITGWPNPPDCINLSHQCHDCPTWPNLIVKINKLIKETIFRFAKISVVCPSYWIASLLETSNLSRHPIHIIHNGIDPSRFFPGEIDASHKPFGLSDVKKVLLFCGGKRLAGQLPAERKGWDYLAAALESIGRKRNDIRLVYIGDPLNLSPHFPVPVNFIKDVAHDDMKEYYTAADIFILPTLADNNPLTILEAMACKVPIIATNTGGIPEIIDPNRTGIICPPRNSKALEEAIEMSLENQEEGWKMAEEGYQIFINKYTLENMINQYEDVYIQTIANRKQ
jgi:glycosyltransferase involved in cell wall biosynthesis